MEKTRVEIPCSRLQPLASSFIQCCPSSLSSITDRVESGVCLFTNNLRVITTTWLNISQRNRKCDAFYAIRRFGYCAAYAYCYYVLRSVQNVTFYSRSVQSNTITTIVTNIQPSRNHSAKQYIN